MSKWEDLNIEACVRRILSDIDSYPDNDSERLFLTAYQIAIEFNRRFRTEAEEIGFKVGGKDIGEYNSLAKYLAGQLSQRIKSEEITDIEIAYISNNDLKEISFSDRDRPIVSSLTNSGYPLSMFRLG